MIALSRSINDLIRAKAIRHKTEIILALKKLRICYTRGMELVTCGGAPPRDLAPGQRLAWSGCA